MAGRIVVWSKASIEQRRAILRFWTLHTDSNTFSIKLIPKIKSRMKLILQFPFLGTPTEIEGIRVVFIGHFSIFYKISENEIGFVAFWDNRQDAEKNEPKFTQNIKFNHSGYPLFLTLTSSL